MEDNVYYKEEGYVDYKNKYIKSKWFFKVILILIILIVLTLIIRFLIIPNGKLKRITQDNIEKVYVDEILTVNASAKGLGNLSRTEFFFQTSQDEIAEPYKKGAIIGRKVENKFFIKQLGSFVLTTYAKLGNQYTDRISQKIVVCNRLSAKHIESTDLQLYADKNYPVDINLYLGDDPICYSDVTYEVVDDKIASVDKNGVITPKWIGKTEILVKQGKEQVKINISSYAKNVLVTGLVVDTEEIVLQEKEVTKIEAKVTPDDAINQSIIYSIDNDEVAEVSNKGIITAKKKGTATITVETKEGSYQKQIKVTVK